MKQGKHADCSEILTNVKGIYTITDPFAVKYLVFIYTAFGQNENATALLEHAFGVHSERPDLGE